MFVRFPMEAVPIAQRGSICCFQDFLKEKNEASVSEGQCWERVKWGRLSILGSLPHPCKAPTATQCTQCQPEELAPKASQAFCPDASLGDTGTLVIPGWTLTCGACGYPLLVIIPEEAVLITDDGLCYNLPSSKSYC